MKEGYEKKLFDILNRDEKFLDSRKKSEEDPAEWAMEALKSERQNCDKAKRYSPDFKRMIVRLHVEEKWTVPQIIEEYGVSKATITKWCSDARYENKRRVAEKEKELENMRNDYARLKEENAFLRNALIILIGKGTEKLA